MEYVKLVKIGFEVASQQKVLLITIIKMIIIRRRKRETNEIQAGLLP